MTICGLTNQSPRSFKLHQKTGDGKRCPWCQNIGGISIHSFTVNMSSWDEMYATHHCKYCYHYSFSNPTTRAAA